MTKRSVEGVIGLLMILLIAQMSFDAKVKFIKPNKVVITFPTRSLRKNEVEKVLPNEKIES